MVLLWTNQQATLKDVMAVCIGRMHVHRVTDPYSTFGGVQHMVHSQRNDSH